MEATKNAQDTLARAECCALVETLPAEAVAEAAEALRGIRDFYLKHRAPQAPDEAMGIEARLGRVYDREDFFVENAT